ncbi:MAG: ABC transporter ATP-binding protein, partial [Cytophagales bacterium]|nr:ABC transporter ATP-binding protein [Cytophagales bacterium]
ISYAGKALRRKSHQSQDTLGRINSILEETVQNISAIQSSVAESYFSNATKKNLYVYLKFNLSAIKRSALALPVAEILSTATLCFLLWYVGSLLFGGVPLLSAPEFMTFLLIFHQLSRPARSFADSLNRLHRGLASGERIFEILDLSEESMIANKGKLLARSLKKELILERLSFQYPGSTAPILQDIDIHIPKHSHIALVGRSGGGKTSLFHLIPRFYEPSEGRILLDGHPLAEYELSSLRNMIGIVPQESHLFHDSFYQNISLGRPTTSREIIRAAQIASAHDFIMAHPKGYETQIGDRGITLSGGQRQRLCIARAILLNPPLLLLDEATSALDSESEQAVQKALFRVMEDRTCLSIAHRLSTIQDADTIFVMEKGKIIEHGNHQSLIRQQGRYHGLIRFQFGDKEEHILQNKDKDGS